MSRASSLDLDEAGVALGPATGIDQGAEDHAGYTCVMVSRQVESRAREVLGSTDDQVLSSYLFGSFARGTESPDSDIDIGILLSSEPSATLGGLQLTLEGDLERALGRRVQVIVLNGAPPDLVHRVLRDGRLLLDRDRAARIRFEVDARNRYFDLLPTLEAYRKQKVASS